MNLEDSNLSERILSLLKTYPDGVTQQKLTNELPEYKPENLIDVITKLVKQNVVDFVNQKSIIIFKFKDIKIAAMEKKLTVEEMKINKHIRSCGSKGASNVSIKKMCNLKETDFAKIEKRLISIGLVKEFKLNKQKVYVASDWKPDSSLSEKFEMSSDNKTMESKLTALQASIISSLQSKHERAKKLGLRRLQEFEEAAEMSLEAMQINLEATGAGKITREELRLVLESLVNSCQLSSAACGHAEAPRYRYRPSPPGNSNGYACVPTVACPHRENHAPGTALCPSTCPYLSRYLQAD